MVGPHDLGDVAAQRDLDHHTRENERDGHGHKTEDEAVRAPPCARPALSTSWAFSHLFLAPFCGQCRHHPRFTGGGSEMSGDVRKVTLAQGRTGGCGKRTGEWRRGGPQKPLLTCPVHLQQVA